MDTFINPLTADYAVAVGAAARDPMGGLANAVYLRLMTPLGGYWADITLGSRLHELVREKDKARVATLAKQYAQNALKPILTEGRATEINVTVERVKDNAATGRLNLSVEVLAASGERQTFHFPVRVI
jgi:phage gp46-like protein